MLKYRVWYYESGKLKFMDFDNYTKDLVTEIFKEGEIIKAEVVFE